MNGFIPDVCVADHGRTRQALHAFTHSSSNSLVCPSFLPWLCFWFFFHHPHQCMHDCNLGTSPRKFLFILAILHAPPFSITQSISGTFPTREWIRLPKHGLGPFFLCWVASLPFPLDTPVAVWPLCLQRYKGKIAT